MEPKHNKMGSVMWNETEETLKSTSVTIFQQKLRIVLFLSD